MDSAAGSLLQRIGGKVILPIMAQLLDSPDPDAQLRTASFFASFALFADKDGSIAGTGAAGPFYSELARAQMPRRNSRETPTQYAQFWKNWWRENYSKLGFSNP
jgi:hypothetical protein